MDALQPDDPHWVGRYRLLKRLGTGGMGRVYLGQSPGGRLVAVKLIRPELADDPSFRRRFAQEVSAARRVSGIFTAPVVDADPDGPQPWLVTAYVAGPSLSDAVEARGPMPVRSVLTLAAGLAEGLGAVHAAGVVHRDLKPSNVLLASDGPRIIDFGISRAMDSAWLTNVGGVVVGSPGFMSPEQAEGRDVGPATDIFSLGGVLAYAATGQAPFGAGPASALLYRVVYGAAATGYVPEPLRPLVERCLAKDPADRPSTEELLAELGYAEPGEDWLSWSAAVEQPADQLAATRLDQASRWAAGDHHDTSGNGAVLAGPISPERGGLADHHPVAGNPAGITRLDSNPADGRSANRRRADEIPATVTDPVTAPRSARHNPSGALIRVAVAAVLAAGTAGAVAYVVASDHDHVSSHAAAVTRQAESRTGDDDQDSEADAQVRVTAYQVYFIIQDGQSVQAIRQLPPPTIPDDRAQT
ncbi:MAG TPA: serine/threonine-protein kinase [Streptosporangiaceae bacterium]|nr:serine/threonine-protein kinase [Streptosporangiaceae bacterium]